MDVKPSVQDDASAISARGKPAVPKKPVILESDATRRTHVREMVRKLQEKDQPTTGTSKPIFLKLGAKASKPTEKDEMGVQASNQTLEDLKAIDEDIEKLRKQIEERDKIISALREAAEAKDKKLDNLLMENSKLRSDGKLDLDTSPEPNRATSSSPSSPPLCTGELCWTDSFVNKNYHEPVYAQLLNDHTALQKTYNDLRTKLESKGKELERLKAETEAESPSPEPGAKSEENAINLIMAEQIRALKEREAQLIWEAEELREQNDLMEFRILELEECRKEFLDKEMKSRPEKIVWRERDFEEISDSGVMSLPTSEDLTSDSELGDAIRNYSPLGAITTLGPLTPETGHHDPDLKPKKSLKSSECLQESGIFVDSDAASEKLSKACQTDSVLDQTLLDIIDSSCDLFLSKNPGYLSEDLSTEISKLSVIQKRIQQKTKPTPAGKSPHAVFACPHSNSLLFYEERLGQLEDKLKIYESSGDTKEALLARRLQKEVELAHRVKELTDKVTSLEATNRKLEEEKCEFEEAENDTRFQCQRLEIRLQELIDKNTELELELERQKVIMSEERRREKKKGSLEGLLSKYEQRNFELEEKEVEARRRLSMIEAAMPAIVAWNVFKMTQNSDFVNVLPGAVSLESDTSLVERKIQVSDPAMVQRLEEILDDQKKLRKDYERVEESAADREKALRDRIEELEAKAAKDREMLEEMTNSLKSLKSEERPEGGSFISMRPEEVDLFEELKQMVANEIELRAEIERLEKKEQAYMQSLEKADEIWAGMEADYKRRLTEAEEANADLQMRVSQLEATQMELEKALAEQPAPQVGVSQTSVQSKIEELILENERLTSEITRSLDKKFEEHRRFLESENASLREELRKIKSEHLEEEKKYLLLEKELEKAREELYRERELRGSLREKSRDVGEVEEKLQNQISELTQELSRKSKELSNLEVTVAELREEVETLEGKVSELVETIQTTISNQQEGASTRSIILRDQASQWSLPVSVDLRDVRSGSDLSSTTSEVLVKTEMKLPSIQVLIPSEFRPRWMVFAAPFFLRQEMTFIPPPNCVSQILVKTPEHSSRILSSRLEERKEEDEIFQLSLKNTELQQTLERIEEESKVKDRELAELQKLALEIRRELLSEVKSKCKGDVAEETRSDPGESTLRVCDYDSGVAGEAAEDLGPRPSIDILQIINPIVVKTSDQIPHSLSSLQIAIDNLQNKCRSKSLIMKPLLDDVNQKGDNRGFEDIVNQLALEFPQDAGHRLEGRPRGASMEVTEFQKPRPSTPKKSSSAHYPMILPPEPPRHHSHRLLQVDPDFSFAAPITTVRKVGVDGIFLEWDVSRQPPTVTGFEIKVNGLLTHRVRSSTRNKALLHPLNLGDKISIQLFAMSDCGRSTKCSHAVFPDERLS